MSFQNVKMEIVSRTLGIRLLHLRDLWARIVAVIWNVEQGGTVSQDACTRVLLPRLCAPDEQFLDVGAHIGAVVAEVKACRTNTEIIAVEAVPEKAAHLARRFPDVELHTCAVGDHTGEVQFFVDRRRPGYSSLTRMDSDVVEINVPMHTLDDLIPDEKRIGVMKIDVEGAELQALRGARQLLTRCRPAVCFESAAPRDDLPDLFALFTELGYEIFVPNRVAHEGPSLCAESFVEAHHYPRRTTDYFALHRDRRAEYRTRARKALGVG